MQVIIGHISTPREDSKNQAKKIQTGRRQRVTHGWSSMTLLSENLISKNSRKKVSEEMAKEAMTILGVLEVHMERVHIC
jgi:hypothetical protein